MDATATGDKKAMPVGKRFIRQDTRDLTELQTQDITANTTSTHSDPEKEAIQLQRRQTEAMKDMEQQQFRKKIFTKQGSLRSIL